MKLSEENENPEFIIHNPKEIAAILIGLMKSRTAINLDSQCGVRMVSSVLKVSHEARHVYLDISPDSRINDQIIYSSHVSFSTQTDIKVRWRSTHLLRATLPDGDAFATAIPEAIERIQRRGSFRISTPHGKDALFCKIPTHESIYEAALFDISAGGMAVLIKGALPDNFLQGEQLSGCSIKFPEVGNVPVVLKICRIGEANMTSSGEQVTRIGMEFVNLSRGADNVIQRYIIQLQAENLAHFGVV
jgi:c-di-GMP-binding flagellar brake protein YcgR